MKFLRAITIRTPAAATTGVPVFHRGIQCMRTVSSDSEMVMVIMRQIRMESIPR